MQRARPEPHAPKLATLAHGSDESHRKEQREDMDMGNIGKNVPHKSSKLQVGVCIGTTSGVTAGLGPPLFRQESRP